MAPPFFSILIPLTDQLAYLLPFTLDGLMLQAGSPSFEVIIIDGTKEGAPLGHLPLDKVQVVKSHSNNTFEMLNLGLAVAQGNYIHCLNPGEFYIAKKGLVFMTKIIYAHDCPAFLHTAWMRRRGFGQPKMNVKGLNIKELKRAHLPHSLHAFWFQKEVVQMMGGFRKRYLVQGGYDLICRYFKEPTLRKAFIRRVVTDYEWRKSSPKWMVQQWWESLAVSFSHFGPSLDLGVWLIENGLRLAKYSCKRLCSLFWKGRFLVLIFPLWLIASANRPVPPAGVVEREIEQEYEVEEIEAEKKVPLLEIDIPEKKLELGGEKVSIQSVEFSGNKAFSSRVLQRIVAKFIHQAVSISEIGALCEAIESIYARKGFFLTKVFAPPQEIQNGVLKIEIIEGKLGEVSVVGNKYYKTKFIARYFEKYQGKPINYHDIIKALLLLDENSDLDVGAVFKKGEQFGTADLIVRVKDVRPLHLMADHNNFGSDHTSPHRTGVKFDWGNLITDGDKFTIVEVVGSPIPSLDFTNGIYHLPINTYGSSFDFSYLFANFKTDRVDKTRYTGRSHIATIKFAQALHRTKRLSTDFLTSFDYKQIQNFGNGIESSYDKLRVLTGGVQIDYIDGWRGRNLFAALAAMGIPHFLGGAPVHDRHDSRVHGGGRFVKLNGKWQRVQKLPWECFVFFNTQLQYSFYKLPLPEQIYIGGVDTVRGYQLAAGIGDSGFYANLELRVPPPFLRAHKIPWTQTTWGEFLQFTLFCDHGQTFSHGQDILREIGVRHHKNVKKRVHFDRAILTSIGAGARLFGPWKFEWSFDVGYPLTDQHRSSETIAYFRVAWHIL
jgi:hemolysin activation/secretion protein